MKNLNKRIRAVLFVLLCLPFCGAWTVAAEQQETRYTGGELISTYASETISYKSKEIVENIATANNAPSYTGDDIGLQNGCGATAGAIVVGFYDKYYPNLISGWDSTYSTGRYRAQDFVYVPALMQDLYTEMKTNVAGAGVSETEFKTGLTSYVNAHGYSLNYMSLGNGNNFNYTSYKTAIQNNEVTVLFVQPSTIYTIASSTNKDVLNTISISGNHIMVAYGYYEVKYTLSNGIRTDKYLRVATGLSSCPTAIYKIGTFVDAAYTVKIS